MVAMKAVLLLLALACLIAVPVRSVLARSAPSHVLYAADWQSGLAGWQVQGGYQVTDGMLTYTGSGSGDALAPYSTAGLKSFAVVADIQAASYTNATLHSFGPFVRYTLADRDKGIYPGIDFLHGSTNTAALYWQGNVDNYALGPAFDPGTTFHRYWVEVQGKAYRLLIDGRQVVPWTGIAEYHGLHGVGVTSNLTVMAVRSFRVLSLRPRPIKHLRHTRPLEERVLTASAVGVPGGQGLFLGNGQEARSSGLDVPSLRRHHRVLGYVERFDTSAFSVIEDLEQYRTPAGATWAYTELSNLDQQRSSSQLAGGTNTIGQGSTTFTMPSATGKGSTTIIDFHRGVYAVRLQVVARDAATSPDPISLAQQADALLR